MPTYKATRDAQYRDKTGKARFYRTGDTLVIQNGDPKPSKFFALEGGEKPPAGGNGGTGNDKPMFPKHIAGGLYELPDGSRVKGKDAAIAAMEAMAKG